MTTPEFDAEAFFGDDYLYFFADDLEERSDAETDLIWQLLALRPGMEVLDLACGHGRIANRLAGRGCRVTGLDSTELFLDRARRDAAERGVAVEYVRGDMRRLPWRDQFDAIINWFTAFGYFDDAGNQQVLAQASAALRPGGRLALEMAHYLRLLRDYQPAVAVERNGDLVVDQHHLDPLTGRIVATRTYLRGGVSRRANYSVRIFSYTELRDWLRAAGFTEVAGYGGDGQALTAESRRMIVIAYR
jgi:SAM-dependent methyltransferase